MSDDVRRLEVPVECTGLCSACEEYGLSSDEVANIARPVVAAELDRIADQLDREAWTDPSYATAVREVVVMLRGRAAVLRG